MLSSVKNRAVCLRGTGGIAADGQRPAAFQKIKSKMLRGSRSIHADASVAKNSIYLRPDECLVSPWSCTCSLPLTVGCNNLPPPLYLFAVDLTSPGDTVVDRTPITTWRPATVPFTLPSGRRNHRRHLWRPYAAICFDVAIATC